MLGLVNFKIFIVKTKKKAEKKKKKKQSVNEIIFDEYAERIVILLTLIRLA